MKIGTTSFGFRYSFLDPGKSAKLPEIIRATGKAGLDILQVCENTRPLEMSKADWKEARQCAADVGVELQLGCKTLRSDTVRRYVELAREISCDQLRIVMEEEGEHASEKSVARLLEDIVPELSAAGLRLAIENHFDIPSTVILKVASGYSPDLVGFCVDTANSLRSFEPTAEVLRLLGERACCYHLKDYRIVGTMIGFSVVGAPLGEGELDLDACLRFVFARGRICPLLVETWTPSENDRDGDIARENDWLGRSVRNLRQQLARLAV